MCLHMLKTPKPILSDGPIIVMGGGRCPEPHTGGVEGCVTRQLASHTGKLRKWNLAVLPARTAPTMDLAWRGQYMGWGASTGHGLLGPCPGAEPQLGLPLHMLNTELGACFLKTRGRRTPSAFSYYTNIFCS